MSGTTTRRDRPTAVFAPFGGVAAEVAPDTGPTSDGSTFADAGHQIHLVPDAGPGYGFTFVHISGVTVKPGDRIQTGEQIGYYQVPPGFTPGVGTFDIVVWQYEVASLMQGAVLQLTFMTLLTCQMTGQRGFFVGPPDPADTVTLTH